LEKLGKKRLFHRFIPPDIRMDTREQIDAYLDSQAGPKRGDLRLLHGMVLRAMPGCTLWFLDGRNSEGKVVSNPNIGYGRHTLKYADGKTREFYRIGLSANTAGISVYVMGLEDRGYLARTYGKKIGKADVSGYCIKFRALKDVNLDVLEEVIRESAVAAGGT